MNLDPFHSDLLAVQLLTWTALLVVLHAVLYGYYALLLLAWDIGRTIGAKLRKRPQRPVATQDFPPQDLPAILVPRAWVAIPAALWLVYTLI